MSNLRPASIDLTPPRIDALMAALTARSEADQLVRLGFSEAEIAAVRAVARSQRTSMGSVVRDMVLASLDVLEGRHR
jgi:hypothetical protein